MAIIPAVVLITIIGILSGYGFALIGKVCAYTGATSFRDAWTKSMGAETSWIPAWSTTLKTFLACLAFSMVLADTFSSLLGTERTTTLLGVTTCILLPLCLKKDLKSLAPFSLLGVCGMLYTAIAMAIRFLDGNYASGEGSVGLVAEVARHLKPSFGNKGASSVLSPNALILVCMLSTAYMVSNVNDFYLVQCEAFAVSIMLTLIYVVSFDHFKKSGSLQCPEILLGASRQYDSSLSSSRFVFLWNFHFSDGVYHCCRLLDLWKSLRWARTQQLCKFRYLSWAC